MNNFEHYLLYVLKIFDIPRKSSVGDSDLRRTDPTGLPLFSIIKVHVLYHKMYCEIKILFTFRPTFIGD